MMKKMTNITVIYVNIQKLKWYKGLCKSSRLIHELWTWVTLEEVNEWNCNECKWKEIEMNENEKKLQWIKMKRCVNENKINLHEAKTGWMEN